MQAYWDNIAERVSNGGLKDNWTKRRGLIKHLLDYDITKCRVLEIGCGLGMTAGALKMIYGGFFNYTGTDISPKFCELANKRIGLSTVNTRADSMPFENKSFDCLFAFDVLEHIPAEDKPNVYKELDRVLNDKAFVFINNPHPKNPCGHSDDVEHGFDESDIATMCKVLNMEIHELTTYRGHEGYKYNFIVMRRH